MDYKWIEDYENLYEISNNGQVKRYYKNGNIKILNPSNSNGYLRIELSKKGERQNFLIHRLIAIHFIPNPENKECIDHIDGDKLNNSIENLRWVSHSENMLNKKNYGKYKKGVRYHKKRKKFYSQITLNGKSAHIGYYETEEEAHESYKQKFLEIHGFECCSR